MQSRFASADPGWPVAGLIPALLVFATVWGLGNQPASARPAPIDQLDLTVRPTDVAAAKNPLPTLAPVTDASAGLDTVASPVDEVDKVRPTVTPNRRTTTLGPLGTLGGEEGGVLQELLENKTIPLFRVRMESPF